MAPYSIDITAPIIPGKSLGGLALRTPLVDGQRVINSSGDYRLQSFKLVSPYEAQYRLGSGEVTVCVDVRNGKTFKLIAGIGYRGMLFDTISVGMRVAAAFAALPRLYFHEGEDMILLRQDGQGGTAMPGIALNVAEDDVPLDELLSLPITAISVHIDELLSGAAQRGDW